MSTMEATKPVTKKKSAKAQSSNPEPINSKPEVEQPEAQAQPEQQEQEEQVVLPTAEQEAKLIDKLNKLLVITTENGATEAEAESALLKAQKLMYKYNIAMEKLGGEEAIEYGLEVMDHVIKASPRWMLSAIIAKSFACRAIQTRGKIAFLGHKMDAKASIEAFKFAWQVMKINGEALQRERKTTTGDTHGVFNTYAQGFLEGLKTKLDEQTTALIITVPTDVNAEFDKRFPSVQHKKSRMAYNPVDVDAYLKGVKDGRSVMSKRELPSA